MGVQPGVVEVLKAINFQIIRIFEGLSPEQIERLSKLSLEQWHKSLLKFFNGLISEEEKDVCNR